MSTHFEIDVAKLTLSTRYQARKTPGQVSLSELADSIEAQGLLQNLVVTKGKKRGTYEVIAGGRRLQAMQTLIESGRWAKETTVWVTQVDNEQARRPKGNEANIPGGPVSVESGQKEQVAAALQALRQASRPSQETGGASRRNSPPLLQIDVDKTLVEVPVARVDAAVGTSDWGVLEASILACEVCDLHVGRHSAVPGAGAVEAVDWMVVGEAPGDRDDRLGQPFQGKAGELLHAMLQAAGIDPHKAVFYTNAVKCRPRSNRPPSPAEIAACLPYLHSQISLLKPRGILALGRLAAQTLLADGKPFESQRGQVHAYTPQQGGAIPVVVTYHPASLLSRPSHKAASWRDLNLARTLF